MKYLHILFSLAIIFCYLSVESCDKYDDSELVAKVEALDSRVTALEAWQKQVNSDINSLQITITALKNQDQITSVKKLDDDSGWEITFSKTGSIFVYNGTNGVNGTNGTNGTTPTIGVKLDESDGVYYWTVNGDYLLDDGNNRIPATAHISTPQIRINEQTNNFEISYNGGVSWEVIGTAGLTGNVVFNTVLDTPEQVTFVLADNTIISIPKFQPFALIIKNDYSGISEGQMVLLEYSLSGADNLTVIDLIATDGYSAQITQSTATSGTIVVMPPATVVPGKVFVFAVNGSGQTSMKILTFEEGSLSIVSSSIKPIPASGGSLSVQINTNLDYMVIIPNDKMGWLSKSPETKGIKTEYVTLICAENAEENSRTADISIVSPFTGAVLQTFTIVQEGKSSGEANTNYVNFSTLNNGIATHAYSSYTAENGWSLKNGWVDDSSYWDILTTTTPVLGGRRALPGTLSSPSLSGGCGTLTFSYGYCSGTATKGISFRVDILDDGNNVVRTETITQSSVESKKEYSGSVEVNKAGTFSIVFTNLCPAQQTLQGRDMVDIFKITWNAYE